MPPHVHLFLSLLRPFFVIKENAYKPGDTHEYHLALYNALVHVDINVFVGSSVHYQGNASKK